MNGSGTRRLTDEGDGRHLSRPTNRTVEEDSKRRTRWCNRETEIHPGRPELDGRIECESIPTDSQTRDPHAPRDRDRPEKSEITPEREKDTTIHEYARLEPDLAGAKPAAP